MSQSRKIEKIVRHAPSHWVGDGFPVKSLFSYSSDPQVSDPFLLLDYAGPHTFEPAPKQQGVGEHPHRGFETVTVLLQGELEHRDSNGNRGKLAAGDVQWMTAGRGVVHEELHSTRFQKEGGVLEMIQLWVNLPAEKKLTEPRYQELLAARIPVVELPDAGGSLRVIAGEFDGRSGPAQTFSPIHLWDVLVRAGKTIVLPVTDGFTAAIVAQRGEVEITDTDTIGAGELAFFERAGDRIVLRADSDARFILIAGKPLGEPVVGHGPFVMNTREQIVQAIKDYQAGLMGHLS